MFDLRGMGVAKRISHESHPRTIGAMMLTKSADEKELRI
jgi:hypothetical protein